MVMAKSKFWLLTLAWCFLLCSLCADDVKISAEIDADSAYENHPLIGTIGITHPGEQHIHDDSFRLGSRKLSVDLVKEVQFGSNPSLILSIYHFQIPPQSEGLYALPSVTVTVGDKQYQSVMSSYVVQALKEGEKPSLPAPVDIPKESSKASVHSIKEGQATQPSLRLDAGIIGKATLYPGQYTKLAYRYYYSGDIQLTSEKLPLLDAEGMVKIGEKEFKNYSQDGLSVNQILQKVQAVKPGTFSYGPSSVEGIAYKDEDGKRIPLPDKLFSSAPIVTVTVVPFPDKDRPVAFNGAVGEYQFKVYLESLAEVKIGDEISVVIEIIGKGNLQAVPLPDIAIQPGFSGFFKFNDLPPIENIQGNTKKSIVRLRPLSEGINAIPSIAFAFFDPASNRYQVVHSQSIPITVRPAVSSSSSQTPPPPSLRTLPRADMLKEIIPQPSAKPLPTELPPANLAIPVSIEIEGIFSLESDDLYNKLCGSWWVLSILPLGVGLLIYQRQLRLLLLSQQAKPMTLDSKQLLAHALQQREGSSAYFEGINRALLQGLYEAGTIPSSSMLVEELPSSGMAGQAKIFIEELEKSRFAGKRPMDFVALRQQVLELLQRILANGKSPLPSKGEQA